LKTIICQRFLCILVIAGLAGCGGGTPMRIFVLTSPAQTSANFTPDVHLPRYELVQVRIPDYLDTTDILHQTGAQEFAASPTGRWGERLSTGITRALAASLASRLPDLSILIDPPDVTTRRIMVTIEHINFAPSGVCSLSAHWEITGSTNNGEKQIAQGTFLSPPGPTDDPGEAAALRTAIAQLADAIKDTLRTTLSRS